jgi:ferredoxin-NADP reductase/DMSO/TMAO reductase YedYZ heme-binding membrane subunit
VTLVGERPAALHAPGPPPAETSRPVAAHPNGILAAIAAGALAAIALWWHDATTINGLGDWLTSAGRLTGMLAGYGVVVLVALMARLPPLERGIGADRLARWHAMGGRYTVCLIAAHALLITWGYAVTAHTNVVSQTSTLLLSYPDVLLASVGALLLIGVGVVSARAARRRMRYETWYYLHLYTYLAVALAFSHQFADGADFMRDVWARAAWSALYLGVAAALCWYRVLVPLRAVWRHRLVVAAVYPEAPGVMSVVVTGRRVHELRAEPGQFLRWRFLARGLWWTSTPYSLSAAPRGDQLRITVRATGDHSSALAGLRPGTRVLAEGPYGAMTAARRTRRKVLLIAGGIGVAPLRALFETLPGGPGDVRLLYRASRDVDVVFRNEIAAIAAARRAQAHIVVGSRRLLGHDPLSVAALTANIPDLPEHDVYVCGPEAMQRDVVAALRAAGVPQRQIHAESFAF